PSRSRGHVELERHLGVRSRKLSPVGARASRRPHPELPAHAPRHELDRAHDDPIASRCEFLPVEYDALALIPLTSAPLAGTVLSLCEPERGRAAERRDRTARIEYEQIDFIRPLPGDHDVKLTLRLIAALVD